MSDWGSIPTVQSKKTQQSQNKQVAQSHQSNANTSSNSAYKPRFQNAKKENNNEQQKEEEEQKFNPETDDKGETDILYRCKEGVFKSKYFLPNSQSFPKYHKKIEEAAQHFRVCEQDPKMIMMCGTKWVVTYNIEEEKVVAEVESGLVSVQNISISKTGKYAQYMDREAKDKFVIHLCTFPDLKPIKSFEDKFYVKENWPPVKMTDDDEIAFKYHYEKQVINVFKLDKIEVIRQFKVGVVEHFELAPGNLKEAVFSVCKVEKMKGFNTTQGRIQIYKMNDMKPVVSRDLEKAQEITTRWAPDGQHLLIKVECMMDATNQSYYGENRLFHFNVESQQFVQVPTYKGPVHDFQWSHDGKQFCVISGFIPAHSVLFSNSCQPEFEFGQHYRNQCFFQPQDRFLVLAGFGNLDGEMEIWDTKTKKLVGKCKSSSAHSCAWSSDGRKFMTAVVTPRLRVDNNFKVFKYDGSLLNRSHFNATELYDVIWFKQKKTTYSDRPVSPESEDRFKQTQIKQQEEKKTEEKKVFKAFGSASSSSGNGSSFAEQMRAMKAQEANSQSRVLNSQSDLGAGLQTASSSMKPGQTQTQQTQSKKKRIRKKDMQKMMEGLEEEAEDL